MVYSTGMKRRMRKISTKFRTLFTLVGKERLSKGYAEAGQAGGSYTHMLTLLLFFVSFTHIIKMFNTQLKVCMYTHTHTHTHSLKCCFL